MAPRAATTRPKVKQMPVSENTKVENGEGRLLIKYLTVKPE